MNTLSTTYQCQEDESSEDSGIMKVRVVSRSTASHHSGHSSPGPGPILVKEFNRTPDILDTEAATEITEDIECEEFIESEDEEDEESRADVVSGATQPPVTGPEDEPVTAVETEPDIIHTRDVVLMEVGPEDSSEIIVNRHNDARDVDNNVSGAAREDLTVDDIECVEETNCNAGENAVFTELLKDEISGKSIDPQLAGWRPRAPEKAAYHPGQYGGDDAQNGSLLQLVSSREAHEAGDKQTYENLINSTILKLEHEELKLGTGNTEEELHNIQTTGSVEDETKIEAAVPLSSDELESLKRKCLTRMKDHQSTPIVVNPPVLKEFSNSQKLINFLDEAEEKDKTILNSVKRSSYNLQVHSINIHYINCH